MEEENQNVDGLTPRGHIKSGWGIMIILTVVIIIGGGISAWYYLIEIKGIEIASPSASTSESPQTAKTKTYTSTSACIGKFSFEYPSDWTIYNDYSVVGQENGGEGGGCLIDIRFLKESKDNKNIMSPLNTRVRATSNTVVPVNIDDMVNWLEGSKTFAELIASSDKTSDVNLGGVNTKMYHLGGMIDWNYIGLVRNNSYYQIELQDAGNEYKNDRGSKAGFETIISTWKFI